MKGLDIINGIIKKKAIKRKMLGTYSSKQSNGDSDWCKTGKATQQTV